MNRPKVTIGIPTFNRKDLVLEAVTSALNQTYSNVEVIVSDDCSSDGTFESLSRISDSRLKLFRQSYNLGMAANWNFCLNQATGQYFNLLGDDDLLSPAFVEETVNFYTSEPDLVFIYTKTNSYTIDSVSHQTIFEESFPDAPRIEDGFELVRQKLLGNRSVSFCGILFKVKSLLDLGGFPLDFPYSADFAGWLKLAFQGKVGYINIPLSHNRYHESNLTFTLSVEKKSFDNFRSAQLSVKEAKSIGMEEKYIKEIQKIGHIRASRATVNRLLISSARGLSKKESLHLIYVLRKCLLGDILYSLPRVVLLLILTPSLYSLIQNYRKNLRFVSKKVL